jgi:hypothetical protein
MTLAPWIDIALGALVLFIVLRRFFPRSESDSERRESRKKKKKSKRPRGNAEHPDELVRAFSIRLSSGGIGVVDQLVRFVREGKDRTTVTRAQIEAMDESREFASRQDKLERWLSEAGWEDLIPTRR